MNKVFTKNGWKPLQNKGAVAKVDNLPEQQLPFFAHITEKRTPKSPQFMV